MSLNSYGEEVKPNENERIVSGENVIVTQDPKMFMQIIKALTGDGDHHTVNIINGIQIVGGIKVERTEEFDLMKFLQALPEPRWKSLKEEIVRTARRFFKTDNEVAEFFGISRRWLVRTYDPREKQKLELSPKEGEL